MKRIYVVGLLHFLVRLLLLIVVQFATALIVVVRFANACKVVSFHVNIRFEMM